MTTRDVLEYLLELREQTEQMQEKIDVLFKKIYAEHLRKKSEVEE